MKIVLTCGHPHSGYSLAHEALVAAGLSPAKPSRRDLMSPAQLHEAICKAHGVLPADTADSQIHPGKVWQDLAVDLFLGNLDADNWGWADARVAWLLEFWKDFDPQIRFVLAYSTPEQAAGQTLLDPGSDVGAAVASWAAYNAEVLRFYHRNPDRSLLVNVESLLHDPGRFVEKTVTAFKLDIPGLPASYRIERTGYPAIAATLVKPFIEECGEAAALYRELESSADFDAVPEMEKHQAWREYGLLLAAHEAALGERQARLELAIKTGEEQARIAAERQKALNAEATKLQSDKAALVQEKEVLLLQLHQVQEEFERQSIEFQAQEKQAEAAAERQKQLAKERDEKTKLAAALQKQLEQEAKAAAERQKQLAKERDEQAKLAAERQRQLEQEARAAAERQRQLEQEARTAAERQKQLEQAAKTGGGQSELAQENKLLLVQLHQVQEELEHYFLKSMQITETPAPAVGNPPAGLVYDLRRDFEGGNWYYAEVDGRWAGPAEASSFKTPPLGAGEYELQIDVVDAMEPAIVDGMRAFHNGEPFPLKVLWKAYPKGTRRRFSDKALARVEDLLTGTPLALKPKAKRYPVLVSGRFAAAEGEQAWEFRLQFPKLVSPAEQGSEDQRKLAVRVRSLKLLPVR